MENSSSTAKHASGGSSSSTTSAQSSITLFCDRCLGLTHLSMTHLSMTPQRTVSHETAGWLPRMGRSCLALASTLSTGSPRAVCESLAPYPLKDRPVWPGENRHSSRAHGHWLLHALQHTPLTPLHLSPPTALLPRYWQHYCCPCCCCWLSHGVLRTPGPQVVAACC